jgi:hypothetical protein
MSDTQRRKAPRYAFIATAELLDEGTEARIATRVSELSLHGCYLDMLNPLPENTTGTVKISAGDKVFESKARVVYVHPNLGVGIIFVDPEPKNLEVLQKWLKEAEQDPERLLK